MRRSMIYLLQATQVEAAGAGAGIEGRGIAVGGKHIVHLAGIFCGKVQPHGPKSQFGKVILPIQPVELLAVEHHAAALVAVPDHGEFRAGAVTELDHAQIAGAAAGAAGAGVPPDIPSMKVATKFFAKSIG